MAVGAAGDVCEVFAPCQCGSCLLDLYGGAPNRILLLKQAHVRLVYKGKRREDSDADNEC
jgi:hypothetical protein